MKRILPFLLSTLLLTSAFAQSERVVNVGVKAGFSSATYNVLALRVNGKEIRDFTTKSEVSSYYTLFLRLNKGRHYLQTEASYDINHYSVVFPTQQWYELAKSTDRTVIGTNLTSIGVPLLYGYHTRKENFYGMSFYIGPKINFILPALSSNSYENFTQETIVEHISPVLLSTVLGYGINIKNLFFDFSFQIGLNQVSNGFITYHDQIKNDANDITFQRRRNDICFSAGFIF